MRFSAIVVFKRVASIISYLKFLLLYHLNKKVTTLKYYLLN